MAKPTPSELNHAPPTSGPSDWIDAHCHLSDPRLEASLGDLLQRSREQGIVSWIQGGICPDDWKRQRLLQARHGKNFLTSFGLHPWWVAAQSSESIHQALHELQQQLPQAQALGELGLDFGEKFTHAKPAQETAFTAQLELVQSIPKPLVLHIVRAHGEAIALLQKYRPFPKGGLIHSFSGDEHAATAYLEMGFLISLSGTLTRKGYHTLKKAIPLLPLNGFVIETDSPDQTPRADGIATGALNEPANLIPIAKAVGALKGMGYVEVLNQSTENLKRLFEIPS